MIALLCIITVSSNMLIAEVQVSIIYSSDLRAWIVTYLNIVEISMMLNKILVP